MSVGKDELFDRAARIILTSGEDVVVEAFLLSYPTVVTPKNDLARLWVEEYHKVCSVREGKKHQENKQRLLAFMRVWAKSYPHDFTPASRKTILEALKQGSGDASLVNEIKLLFLKRVPNLHLSPAGADHPSSSNGADPLLPPPSSSSSGNATSGPRRGSVIFFGSEGAPSTSPLERRGGMPPSFSDIMDHALTSRKPRSATIDGCTNSSRPPGCTETDSFLASSLSSSRSSPPPSPGRWLAREHTVNKSAHNKKNLLAPSNAAVGDGRKKDQISLREKDQKVLKKMRSQYKQHAVSLPRTTGSKDARDHKSRQNRKKFLDFSSTSMARELTMQEWEIFKSIEAREFLSQSWQKENKQLTAPNIVRMIDRFNRISFWVATEILTKDRKTQVRTIKKFIKTAYICYHMGNFNSMMEILSGLNNISVSRLKDAWRMLPERYKAYFEELESVMDNQQNFARYRDQLAKRELAREPALPYFGLFLRYFTYLDDGNPSYGPDNSINISAMVLRLEHVQKVMRYQSLPHNLSRNEHVKNFLDQLNVIDDEDMLYAMSLASQAPSHAILEQQIASEPDVKLFSEELTAAGSRNGSGFSHNRPFLPNEASDETKDDISEESTSFLDSTTENSTLDREEDGTEVSLLESDFEDEEERHLEEKMSKLRQQILEARSQKEQIAHKIYDLHRNTLQPSTRRASMGSTVELRSRVLREMGQAARRVKTLKGGDEVPVLEKKKRVKMQLRQPDSQRHGDEEKIRREKGEPNDHDEDLCDSESDAGDDRSLQRRWEDVHNLEETEEQEDVKGSEDESEEEEQSEEGESEATSSSDEQQAQDQRSRTKLGSVRSVGSSRLSVSTRANGEGTHHHVYIPALCFEQGSTASHTRDERDPYSQYISPRVNTLPYSPRRRSSNVLSSILGGKDSASAVLSSAGIRLKNSSRRSGANRSSAVDRIDYHSEEEEEEEGCDDFEAQHRDGRMEKTASTRFFAHLSEGVPEVMKSITSKKQPELHQKRMSHSAPNHPQRRRSKRSADGQRQCLS